MHFLNTMNRNYCYNMSGILMLFLCYCFIFYSMLLIPTTSSFVIQFDNYLSMPNKGVTKLTTMERRSLFPTTLTPFKRVYTTSQINAASSINMYFDDISRNSLKWTIPTTTTSDNISTNYIPKEKEEVGLTIDKFDNVLLRKLNDYNHASSSSIKSTSLQTDEMIRNHVDLWVQTSTRTIHESTSSLYNSNNLLGPTIICHSNTIFGILNEFWNATKVMIERDYSNHHQFIRSTNNLGFVLPEKSNIFTQYITFPNALNDYDDFVLFQSILNIAKKEHTTHITNQLFTIEIYHPNQNSTLYTSCPYPVIALQYKPVSSHEQQMKELKLQKDYMLSLQNDKQQKLSTSESSSNKNNNIINKPLSPTLHRKKPKDEDIDDADDEDNYIVNEPILDLSNKQNYFKRIYNMEAAIENIIVERATDIDNNDKAMNSNNQNKYFLISDNNDKSSTTSTTNTKTNQDIVAGDGIVDSGISNLRKLFDQYHHEHYCTINFQNNDVDSDIYLDDTNMVDSINNIINIDKIATTGTINPSVLLLQKFQLEYRLRTRNFTVDEIQAISMMWINEQIDVYKNHLFDYYNNNNNNDNKIVTSESTTTKLEAAVDGQQHHQNRFWFGHLISRKTPQLDQNAKQDVTTSSSNKDEQEDSLTLDSMEHSNFRIKKTYEKTSSSSNGYNNNLMQHHHHMENMEWIISNEKDGEYVYADLWSTMERLQEKIMTSVMLKSLSSTRSSSSTTNKPSSHKATMIKRKEQQQQQENSDSDKLLLEQKQRVHYDKVMSHTSTTTKTHPQSSASSTTNSDNINDISYTNLYSWMNKIVKPVVVIEEQQKQHREQQVGGSSGSHRTSSMNYYDDDNDIDSLVTSSSISDHERHDIDGSLMFVVTDLYPFNAEAFKRFAVTIHIALRKSLKLMEKQIQQQQQQTNNGGSAPKIHYYLEVFHPEYVGSTKGYNHSLRRSPFPMIQICYQII